MSRDSKRIQVQQPDIQSDTQYSTSSSPLALYHQGSPSWVVYKSNKGSYNYELNKMGTVRKKLEATNRMMMEGQIKSGNNITVRFSTATFEYIREKLIPTLKNNTRAIFETRYDSSTDKYATRDIIKVALSENTKYTVNMYRTTCTILINGKGIEYLQNDILPQWFKDIDESKEILGKADKEIQQALKLWRADNLMQPKSKTETGDSPVKMQTREISKRQK